MVSETIKKIEKEIKTSDNISPAVKDDLICLFEELKGEIDGFSLENEDQAKSIAGFTEMMAHESTRTTPSPELKEISGQALNSTVKGFEISHPKLTGVVNAISDMLSGIGI